MPQHHNNHSSISPLSTFLLAACFLLALFPGTFVGIAWAPYHYVFPAAQVRQSVKCTRPNICVEENKMSWYLSPPPSPLSHANLPFPFSKLRSMSDD
jgi:hypothetical protein